MGRMPITQLTYLSRNGLTGDAAALSDQLGEILAVSRRNNQRDGITGYLVSDGTWFLQILEGDHEKVMAALVRIRFDQRHSDVAVISTREIRTRSFPHWSMGGSVRTPAMQAIFRRHRLDGLDPAAVTAPAVLALAMDLQDFEQAQGLTRRAG
jgi:Sensors of blue-light using FAD